MDHKRSNRYFFLLNFKRIKNPLLRDRLLRMLSARLLNDFPNHINCKSNLCVEKKMRAFCCKMLAYERIVEHVQVDLIISIHRSHLLVLISLHHMKMCQKFVELIERAFYIYIYNSIYIKDMSYEFNFNIQ